MLLLCCCSSLAGNSKLHAWMGGRPSRSQPQNFVLGGFGWAMAAGVSWGVELHEAEAEPLATKSQPVHGPLHFLEYAAAPNCRSSCLPSAPLLRIVLMCCLYVSVSSTMAMTALWSEETMIVSHTAAMASRLR